jgi:hypothetical protein
MPQATEQQWMLQHNLLPLNVQRKLRNGETVIAESHPAATVLWADSSSSKRPACCCDVCQQQQQCAA